VQEVHPQLGPLATAARLWRTANHVPPGKVPVRGARGLLELLLVWEGMERKRSVKPLPNTSIA
jgi:hypothetical protein